MTYVGRSRPLSQARITNLYGPLLKLVSQAADEEWNEEEDDEDDEDDKENNDWQDIEDDEEWDEAVSACSCGK